MKSSPRAGLFEKPGACKVPVLSFVLDDRCILEDIGSSLESMKVL